MKKSIKLNESKLKKMISETVKKTINEAENYGWVVDESEAQEAYEMAVKHMGKETVDNAIIQSLSDSELAESLAYIFRMYDFEEWNNRNNEEEGLYESKLKKITNKIHRQIRKQLMEGGHLYHQDDDGTIYTNSNQKYRGVPNSTFIYHGEWSDPEVIYNGKSINVNDVEDFLWEDYKADCEENGEQPTEDGFNSWITPDKAECALMDMTAEY